MEENSEASYQILIMWKHEEAYLSENADKTTHVGPVDPRKRYYVDYAIPTRGNCKECGGNGTLGNINK